jgi:hypothetical protein
MWGGQVRRERFCTAKTTEIAASAGQKILFSGRGVVSRFWTSAADKPLVAAPALENAHNGPTIVVKTHAKIGPITHLSMIRVEGPEGPALPCVPILGDAKAFDILLASTSFRRS